MCDQDKVIGVYDYIYSRGPVRNPDIRSKMMLPYGSHKNRDLDFIAWITENIPKGSRVLDASCGRAHLAIALHDLGYEVEATEVSSWLIENELKKLPFPVHMLRYDQLDQLPEKSFDVVCSSDVLEHMISKKFVVNALDNLFRLAKSAICITIGRGHYADRYPRALSISADGDVVGAKKLKRSQAFNLHTFMAPKRWWLRRILPRFSEKSLCLNVQKKNIGIFGFLNDV